MQSTLFDVIGRVETLNNYKSFRFEPTIYEKLLKSRTQEQQAIISRIIKAHGGPIGCSWNTALTIYSSSYGAVQLMGFNLYGACYCPCSVVDYMADKCLQSATFSELLKTMHLDLATPELLASSSVLRNKFAVVYNGSPAYAARIVDALKCFGYEVKD